MPKFNYQETVTKKKLNIQHDKSPESPRTWSNLGYFITVDRSYSSPDSNEVLERIVKTTGNEADSLENHMKLIKKAIKEETGEKVLAIYPISKYEHSGISYSMGTHHGFDYSNNGFYIITDKSQKELGSPKRSWENIIEGELETYNAYCNGYVYQFTLFGDNGEIVDSCGGFYDIEDIKGHLPEEWANENLNDYIV